MLSESVQTTPTGSPGKAVGDLMNTRYFSDSGSHGSPPRSGCSTPEAPRCLPKAVAPHLIEGQEDRVGGGERSMRLKKRQWELAGSWVVPSRYHSADCFMA